MLNMSAESLTVITSYVSYKIGNNTFNIGRGFVHEQTEIRRLTSVIQHTNYKHVSNYCMNG